MDYAVLLYQQGDLWCAEVPDLDYDGAFAPTRDAVLALIRRHIQNVRARSREQGVEHQPEHQCVMLTIDETAPYTPWEDGAAPAEAP